ncbi:MAG: HAD family hydrolase [Actinomycetota bacterium]
MSSIPASTAQLDHSTTGPLVVTDLDGSLWDGDLRCHPETLAAVAELEARGVELLVATGRQALSAEQGLRGNGLVLPSVLLNGALGVDFASGDRFHVAEFGANRARELLALFESHGVNPVLYLGDGDTAGRPNVTTSPRHRASMGEHFEVADPEAVVADRPILSLAMIGVDRRQVEPLADAMPDGWAEVTVYRDVLYDAATPDQHWSIHVQPAGISKQTGIEAYLQTRDLRPERVIVIGDGNNDLEMLAAADVALGVAGGHEEALALADEVIPAPAEGGWARVLDHLPAGL